MIRLFTALALLSSIALSGPAQAQSLEDDADCVAALSFIGDVAEAEDQDSIFAVTMFFLGRLDGTQGDHGQLLAESFDAAAADPGGYAEKANVCADRYAAVLTLLDRLTN